MFSHLFLKSFEQKPFIWWDCLWVQDEDADQSDASDKQVENDQDDEANKVS